MFDDYSAIDMSTVNPNLTMDDTVNGGDGGAADLANVASSVAQWGSVIGSIVTNTPITAAQTRSGTFQTIGPLGTQLAPSPINWTLIGLFALGAVVLLVVVQGSK
jgi:hypothetical protein